MIHFIKKIHIVINFLLITSISYTYGDYDNSSACRKPEECFSCRPASCGKGFLSADLLYWRAFESGLDTCVPTEVCDCITSDGKVISRFSGRSRDPHFKWNPGFRIGTGYEFACNGWDVATFWTHFCSHTNKSENHGNEIQWNIKLDVVDIIAGYKANLNSCFSLRPFIGLRGARIKQKLRIDTCNNSTNSPTCYSECYSQCYSEGSYSLNDLNTIGTNNKERFSGIGPLIGAELGWNIGCGFSLYTSVSISWLYGKFNIKLIESNESVDIANFCEVRKHLNTSLAGVDAALGIRWQTCFCTDMQLILKLGLEHHRYFDYNRIGDYGDLSFDGVNFSAAVAF